MHSQLPPPYRVDNCVDNHVNSARGVERFQPWSAQLIQAATKPMLVASLLRQQRALYDRFVAAYQEVRLLARQPRRRLLRTLGTSLTGAALALALSNTPVAQAASITVSGTCTLVNAITAANTNTATNGCTAGSGADTIVLAANSVHTLSSINNTGAQGPNGLPIITSPITITGNSATLTRSSGADNFRILQIGSGGSLTINNLTISGGVISPGGSSGGAIYNGGTLVLNNSKVSGNSANSGGGLFNNGTMTLSNSTVSGNTAGTGGGINNNTGTTTLSSSTVSGNTASSTGGGGGIISYSTLTVSNSTISGNTATTGPGGGISNQYSTVVVKNSTISGNSATSGGGIFNDGTASLGNSIVANQTAGGNCLINAGPFTSLGFNLANDSSCSLTGTGDIANGSANLGPLQINAPGTTATHALLTGSQAINAGNCSGGTITTDQRGVARPQGAACDIGAFEVKVITSSVSQTSVATGAYNATATACGAASLPSQTIAPTLRNNTATAFSGLFFKVITLEYKVARTDGLQPKLCNADVPGSGVGGTLTTSNLAGNGTLTQSFVVGLPARVSYRLFVDLYSSSALAATSNHEATGEYLGSFAYEFDDNGQLIEPPTTLFLPLVVK